jgi:hypothetical protein
MSREQGVANNFLGASGYADRALRGSALTRSGPTCREIDLTVTKVPYRIGPLWGQETPAGVAAPHPFNPLRTNRKAPAGLRLRRMNRRGGY